MEPSSKPYVFIAFGLVAALFGTVAVIDVIVDPYFIFGSATINTFTPYKETLPEITAKAELARKLEYDTLYLGTSRTEVGMDPLSPFHGGRSCYNAGVPACKPDEATGMFRIAMEHNDVERVYLIIDFMMIRAGERNSYDYLISRANPELGLAEYYLLGLFGYRSIDDSIKTLENWLEDDVIMQPERAVRGHYPMDREVARASARALFNKSYVQYLTPGRGYYATHRYSSDTLQFIEAMAGECAARGAMLYLMVPPLHAVMYEGMREFGIWKDFEQLKRDAAQIAAIGDHVEGWDFSGYTAYTTEPAPETENDPPLQWHYEPAHFRPALGDLMLQQIRGLPLNDPPGERLTAENVERRIQAMRAAREAWAAANEPEIARVRAVARGKE